MCSAIQLPWQDTSAHWRSSASAKWLQPQFMVLANKKKKWIQPEQLLSHHPALSPGPLAGSTGSPCTGDRKCHSSTPSAQPYKEARPQAAPWCPLHSPLSPSGSKEQIQWPPYMVHHSSGVLLDRDIKMNELLRPEPAILCLPKSEK